jgi:colicin import membrane protein
LKKVVRREFGDGVLGEEEKMLLKQLNALHMDYNYRTHLFKCRDAMERASKRDEERAQKLARRDAVVEKFVEMESEAEEKARRRRLEEEEQRQRREELRRREQEKARKQREIEELERERLRRWVEELAERGRQQEQERLRREAREKEEAERRANEDAEARRRFQENIRRARELFAAGDASSIRRQFEAYEGPLTNHF